MYAKILFTLILLVILFNGLTDLYIYRRFLKGGPRKYTIIHWGISALFVLGVIYVISIAIVGQGKLYRMMWFTFGYFLVYLPKIMFMLTTIPSLLIKGVRRSTTILGLGLSFALMFGFLYGLTFGITSLRVEKTEIINNRLPKGFDNLKVVHISDIHLGNLGEGAAPLATEMVERINGLQPDLICFSGDLVNSRSEELDPYKSVLSQLKARYGVYAVLGNHDYSDYARFESEEAKQENFNRLVTGIEEMGWILLNNRSTEVINGSDTLIVTGVENWGEPPFPQYGDMEKARSPKSEKHFTLLLSHNPEHWRLHVQHDPQVDLTLSGHTHALQFKVQLGKFKWSPSQYKYPNWGGLYKGETNHLYVNEGVGYVFIPFRLGTNPEISLLTIRRRTSS